MSAIEELSDLIRSGYPEGAINDTITENWRKIIDSVFGERYNKATAYSKRVVLMNGDDNISFAGLLPKDSPNSGAYGGMCLVWFPVRDDNQGKSLLALGVGTRGLSPDEETLTRPGHIRYLQAIRKYITEKHDVFVWCKQDPANITEQIPKFIKDRFPSFSQVFSRYGTVLYCIVEVPQEEQKALDIVKTFFDWYGYERGWKFNKLAETEFEKLKTEIQKKLFPKVSEEDIYNLLKERLFVILQGPPGTGKTRLALNVMHNKFHDHGFTVQFHPAISYENFISGIAPSVESDILKFKIAPGWLVQAASEANSTNEYLFHVDEINRADLSKILGEAIFLLESRDIKSGIKREVSLSQPVNGQSRFSYPKNLFILGTMNSADRSIAIMDLAVRRRFAFVDIWPDINVVDNQNFKLATEAFSLLVDVFTQYASSDAFVYLPGHAYFLANSEAELIHRFRFELMPLLNEYISNGRVASLENELRGYLDWLETEIIEYEKPTIAS
jgi:5-methylcytosine-specific restriction protein B